MHSVYSADLAGLISHHGPAIIQRGTTIPTNVLTEYWATSRSRFELWHQLLSRYNQYEQAGHTDRLRRWWREHSVMLEEVLVTEMLTRVVAALACGLEAESEMKEISPVTNAVQTSHLEVRNRVQQVMLFGRGNSVHDVVRLNRLRQGVERWTDAVVGRMASDCTLMIQFAIDQSRASDYAEETRAYGQGSARNTSAYLMNAAMHDLLRRRTSPLAAFPRANRMIAKSVMQMFRPELFDGAGTMKSVWLHRYENGGEQKDQFLKPAKPQPVQEVNQSEADDAQFERWYI
ncbi:MAG: hypothetical protein VYA84_12575 [Planctomycetota bacterium]|nr:hypothetical protein [Planctomycetota bacterium]